MTLDRYPYGCAEQTTSRAMPLLYVSELAKAAGMPEDPDLHGRIQDAIYRVLNYQSLDRQLRPVGAGLRRHVARFLRHRLPDPGPRAGLRRAAPGDAAGARQSAELARLRRRRPGPRQRDRLCALRAGPQPQGLDRRPALLCRHAARAVRQPDGAWPSWRRALRSTATRSAPKRPSRRRCSWPWTITEVDYYRSDYGSPLRDGAAMLALAAETKPMPAACRR